MKEEIIQEEIIQAANEYVGHAEEAEEELSTYCNRKAFVAGAKWMQEKMIEKMQKCLNNIEWCDAGDYIWYSKSEIIDLLKQTMEE